MTALDEVNFAEALLAIHPSTRFVSMGEQSETGQPIFRSRIDECKGAHVTIVDSSLVSQDDFHVRYVKPHPSGNGWIYALVGSGLMSLLKARTADFLPNSLINGELRASIPVGDQRTEKFVEIVLNAAKLHGERVVEVDAESGQRGTRTDRRFIAWPDAARKCDGAKGAYLANGLHALFVAKIARKK
ncbi:hypothetical protein [Stenotrophomonas sp. PFBMAA-4]|uniref:hypothetical protein n=1 Tax=Stenotrophomonas sp. PFBMAA-4 TaxID=3043301 RepID=UPI0024B5E37A|nr:hypothetical protein [Stenotrophomonas sp. PFBMAA-4]MDI9271953.1 hypothetical protein [Stenotrophomonas sp. PFBMAA-4]